MARIEGLSSKRRPRMLKCYKTEDSQVCLKEDFSHTQMLHLHGRKIYTVANKWKYIPAWKNLHVWIHLGILSNHPSDTQLTSSDIFSTKYLKSAWAIGNLGVKMPMWSISCTTTLLKSVVPLDLPFY